MSVAFADAAAHAGSFPVMSFLHVPGKMSQPLWLMMGTAFLLRPPSVAASRVLFLSAKHTFAPWEFVTDPARLKIPDEFRRARFVIARLYFPDSCGVAVAGSAVDLRVLALHPTRDVALLAAQADAFSSGGGSSGVLSDGVAIAAADFASGAQCGTVGFRGAGDLGELDTFDPDLLARLPAERRDALLAALRSVEGRQVAHAARLEVLDARGMCRALSGQCFHGMSGAPLIAPAAHGSGGGKVCGGVLYGRHAEHAEHLGFTPASEFAEWLAKACADAAA